MKIMSQDKGSIDTIRSLEIEPTRANLETMEIKYAIRNDKGKGNYHTLGIYCTKERAKEVLKEIYENIEKGKYEMPIE